MKLPNTPLTKILFTLIGMVLFITVGVSAYLLIKGNTTPPKNQTATTTSSLPKGVTTTDNPLWNLYTSETYHFSMEFPSNWRASSISDESGTQIDFILPESQWTLDIIQLKIDYNPENLTLMQWYEKFDFVHKYTYVSAPSEPNATIAGVSAIILTVPKAQSSPRIETFLQQSNIVYHFRYSDVNRGENVDGFLHMIETFEFDGKETEDSIPSDLKQYITSQYH